MRPSDVLTALLQNVFTACLDRDKAAALDAALVAMAKDVTVADDEEWLIEPEELCRSVVDATGNGNFDGDPAGYPVVLTQIQRLDRWHKPVPPHRIDMPRQQAHRDAEDRLASSERRYNGNPEAGSLIPGRSSANPYPIDGDAEAGAGAGGLMVRLLDTVAYLPPLLAAEDADDKRSPARSVTLRYEYGRASNGATSLPAGLKVTIAPMAETEQDLVFVPSATTYSIRPNYLPERINAVVKAALGGGTHLLCFPEMSIPESELGRLKSAIIEESQNYAIAQNAVPALRYVFAGIVTQPDARQVHRNYVVLLDGRGEEIARQDKLTHWNLRCCDRARFGRPTGGAALLHEGTMPGTTLTITDLDGFGRVVPLICADMDADMPGNWLLENVRIDWLYAPVMDGSTCWTQPGTPPWIIGRAAAAADRSGGRVIVTNSMTLTRWNNSAIEAEIAATGHCDFTSYTHCGIALLLDATAGSLVHHHVTVALASMTSPVVESRLWVDDWREVADARPAP